MEKRIRRLTVEIERRRVEWNSTHGKHPPQAQSLGTLQEEPAGPCPTCGAEWLLLQEAAGSGQEPVSSGVWAMLSSLNLHLQSTPSGRLWICRNSFDQLKENL
jgi:hypothetical protein